MKYKIKFASDADMRTAIIKQIVNFYKSNFHVRDDYNTSTSAIDGGKLGYIIKIGYSVDEYRTIDLNMKDHTATTYNPEKNYKIVPFTAKELKFFDKMNFHLDWMQKVGSEQEVEDWYDEL